MDRTCVEHRPPRKHAVPRRLNAPTPTLATVAEGTPATNAGVLRARFTQARRASHAMVVAHFFESGQRRRLRWGRVESATANGRRSSAGQHRVHSCDRRKGLGGAHVGSARASRVPHSVSRHCPRRTAREQSTRGARSSHPFGAGAGSQPSCGRRGQAVVRRTVPLRSLDDWLVPACYQ